MASRAFQCSGKERFMQRNLIRTYYRQLISKYYVGRWWADLKPYEIINFRKQSTYSKVGFLLPRVTQGAVVSDFMVVGFQVSKKCRQTLEKSPLHP